MIGTVVDDDEKATKSRLFLRKWAKFKSRIANDNVLLAWMMI